MYGTQKSQLPDDSILEMNVGQIIFKWVVKMIGLLLANQMFREKLSSINSPRELGVSSCYHG